MAINGNYEDQGCTTHHHACDCREARFKQLEDALRELARAMDEMLTTIAFTDSREARLLHILDALERYQNTHAAARQLLKGKGEQ